MTAGENSDTAINEIKDMIVTQRDNIDKVCENIKTKTLEMWKTVLSSVNKKSIASEAMVDIDNIISKYVPWATIRAVHKAPFCQYSFGETYAAKQQRGYKLALGDRHSLVQYRQ